ncbi:membrane protein FAM174B [Pelodytes ibericus]
MKAVLHSLLLSLLLCGALGNAWSKREQESPHSSPAPGVSNLTLETPLNRANVTTKATLFNSIQQYMPTIKNVFIFVCIFSTFLIVCLVIKIFRSGKRIRKTRKYDIITTPAERVEMAPLNEDNYEEDESAVFDVKYRYR